MTPADNGAQVAKLEQRHLELEAARDELARANAALEERLKEQTTELEIANKQLDALTFFVSHELRTPLRAVDGFTAMLGSEHGAKLPSDGQRLISVIQRSAAKMARLIEDVVRFARQSRGPLRKERVDMRTLATEVVQELRAEWAGRSVETSVAELPAATGDAASLRQVWRNLISNAAKFSQRREVTRIEIGAREEKGARVYWVKDNGVGFDMRHAQRLFSLFERLHGEDQFTGTGVGLGLVQTIVQRNGGRVWAESVPEQGATFYFSLPGG